MTGRLAFIEPMKARLVEKPPPGQWFYEVKFDGFRAIALIEKHQVRLLSRNNNELGPKFPPVVTALSKLKAADAIIDGEIVALGEEGQSSFQLLQAYDMGENALMTVKAMLDMAGV